MTSRRGSLCIIIRFGEGGEQLQHESRKAARQIEERFKRQSIGKRGS